MGFKMAILVCLILMGLMACVTYYLAKKVSNSLMKYIPVFSFAAGALFFYIKFKFISIQPNAFEDISDMIAIILLLIICSIAFLEAVIIDIVDNRILFRKSVWKGIRLVDVNKVFKPKIPSAIIKKIKGLFTN